MSLVRHFVRSALPLRTVLQDAGQRTLSSCVVGRQLMYTPRVASWCVVRCYAKKLDKDAKKEKEVKAKAARHKLNERELDGIIDSDAMNKEYQEIVDKLKQDYIHSLALRTSTASFEQLMVETEDGLFPLNQLAQIVQKNPTLLIINLVAMPQYTGAVLEALKNSGLNINPQQEGTHTIYVPIPKLSREHREGLAKSAKVFYNQAKDKLRKVHSKYVRKVNQPEVKAHHGKDLLRNISQWILEQMHVYDLECEKLMKAKTKELLGEN